MMITKKSNGYIGLMTLLAVSLSIPAMGQQTRILYKGEITTTTRILKQKGDSLHMDIDFDMSKLRVPSKRSLTLVPVLKSTNGQNLELPAIVVKGRNQYRQYRRDYALMNKEQRMLQDAFSYVVLKSDKKMDSLNYVYSVPFATWMLGSELQLNEDLCGCGRNMQELSTELIDTVENIAPYQVIPFLAYLQPKAEGIKVRDIESECFLDFAVNKTDIRQDFGNNSTELAKISKMVDEIKSDVNLKVTKLTIVGYASPEGSLEVNKKLSEGRAHSLVHYLSSRFDLPSNIYQVQFGGENWDGLIKQVEASDMNYRNEVLDMIKNVGIDEGREVKLMRLRKGVPYRYMLKEMFPALRKANCRIDYQIKEFSIIEAKEIIKTRPQLLSLNEMYLVANTYEKGSSEFNEIFETATRMYPADETATLNAAASALERNDLISAEKYLKRIKEYSDMYNNCMGILWMLKGDYDQAESYLKKVDTDHIKEASLNLEEIRKKRENMELLK